MMPRSARTLSIGVYLLISWQFLSTGLIVTAGAMMLALQADIAGLALLPIGAFITFTGWMALNRLRTVLNTPYL